MVKAIKNLHIHATKQAEVAADIHSKFARKYKCIILDRLKPDLIGLLPSEDVFWWRGGVKTHLFFYFLFNVKEDMTMKKKLLDEVKLKPIFKPVERVETN